VLIDKVRMSQFCPECGRENTDTANFCASCNVNLAAGAASEQQTEASDASSNINIRRTTLKSLITSSLPNPRPTVVFQKPAYFSTSFPSSSSPDIFLDYNRLYYCIGSDHE